MLTISNMKMPSVEWRNGFAAIAFTLLLTACNTTGGTPTAVLEDAQENPGDTTQTADQQISSNDAPVNDPRAYCPKAVLRAGTETFRIFQDGVKKTDEGASAKVRYQATILKVARECNYVGNSLNMKVGVRGRLINGPTNESGSFVMPIRVAVTQGEAVLYSELHKVTATIEPGRSNGTFQFVDANISLPKPEKETIIVYAGFDEGPEDQTVVPTVARQ